MKGSVKKFDVYVSGLCLEPHKGLCVVAAIIVPEGGKPIEVVDYLPNGTTNLAHIVAPTVAIDSIEEGSVVAIHSHHKYFSDAFTEGWLDKWKQRNWRNADGEPVKNSTEWLAYLTTAKRMAKVDVEYTPLSEHPHMTEVATLARTAGAKHAKKRK